MAIDKRGALDSDVFSYRATKDQKVFISYYGKHVTTLSGSKALVFLEEIQGAEHKDAQLVLAKETGNFKRGNEKQSKLKRTSR